jgi:hypothetical protein
MELTEDDIREFQEVWLDEFKEPISPDDARQRFDELLELYAICARVKRKQAGLTKPDSQL